MSRLRSWAVGLTVGDPTLRAARGHIHRDLVAVPGRVSAFAAADPMLQRVVLARLRVIRERHQPANAAQGRAAIVASLTSAGSLVAGFLIAYLSGFFTTMAAVTDPATGEVHGIGQARFDAFATTIVDGIALTALVVFIVAVVVWTLGGIVDERRATADAWIWLYEQELSDPRRSRALARSRRRGAAPHRPAS